MSPVKDTIRRVVETAIHPDVMYRHDEVSQRMGWMPTAWRSARRSGLRVHRYGRRVYVIGKDLITFVRAQSDNTRNHHRTHGGGDE